MKTSDKDFTILYYAAGAINRATKIANKKTLEELKGG